MQKYSAQTIFKKLKMLEALKIKFRQRSINRINFETSDYILKC